MDGCNSTKMSLAALLLALVASVSCLPHPQDTNVNNIRSSYRTAKTPKCVSQHHSPNAPCENDPEYDVHIKARFSKILDNQPMDQLLQEMLALGLDTSHLSVPSSRRRRQAGQNREISFPDDGIINVVQPDPSKTTGFVEESAACQSVKSTIYPKRGKNKNDDWVFIMNQETERQGVTVETCYNEGSSCNLGDIIPGIGTTCRQKYIYKTLLVLTGEGEKVAPEEILMPSTCVCYIRRN